MSFASFIREQTLFLQISTDKMWWVLQINSLVRLLLPIYSLSFEIQYANTQTSKDKFSVWISIFRLFLFPFLLPSDRIVCLSVLCSLAGPEQNSSSIRDRDQNWKTIEIIWMEFVIRKIFEFYEHELVENLMIIRALFNMIFNRLCRYFYLTENICFMQIHLSPHSTFTRKHSNEILGRYTRFWHKCTYVSRMLGFASAENAMPAKQNKWINIYYFGEWRRAIVAKWRGFPVHNSEKKIK